MENLANRILIITLIYDPEPHSIVGDVGKGNTFAA